jgi:hypothetical protein
VGQFLRELLAPGVGGAIVEIPKATGERAGAANPGGEVVETSQGAHVPAVLKARLYDPPKGEGAVLPPEFTLAAAETREIAELTLSDRL